MVVVYKKDGEASWNNDVQVECVQERRCHVECSEEMYLER